MRYIFLFIIGLLPLASSSQNPLKKELVGNTQSVYYSNSQYTFTNYNGTTLFISELADNRSLNWNKQINDSVKIEPIGDYWNYPYKILFKNKINQDLSKANIKIEPTAFKDDMYKVEPTVDVHYPNFVSFPQKGYWVLTKINMKLSKNGQTLFTKSYQEYTFFTKGNIDYKDAYNTDLKEGANVAMWTSMKRVLDQFYKDLNDIYAGKTVESVNTALNVIPRTSNIDNDPNLNTKQVAYSGVKDKPKTTDPVDNYKMEGKVDLPPPTDGKLDNAMEALGGVKKEEEKPKAVAKKPEVKKEVTKVETVVKKETPAPKVEKEGAKVSDSVLLAEKKLKDELRKKAIDSALKVKEELAKAAKAKELEEKTKAKELATLDKIKRDSILKANQLALAEKLKQRTSADSAKRAEINKKIELAKKKREEEKLRLQAQNPVKEAKKEVVAKKEITAPTTPIQNTETVVATPRKFTPKTGNENIGEEVRRIAREVEMEEMRAGNKYKPEVSKPSSTTDRKAEREAFAAKMEQEKNERKLRLDSLLALRKSKAESIINAAKTSKDSVKSAIASKKEVPAKPEIVAKPIDPKKYEQDSIKLAVEKQKRREAILAAQKAAMELERNTLSKNPNAGEMFALVSTDPPSKLPDSRTREQVLADRIFTPKSEISKDLLARVKLITPEEEQKLLSQMKDADVASVDSFFIRQQINRPIPTHKPLDTTTSVKIPAKIDEAIKSTKDTAKTKSTKTKADTKAAIVEKGLKDAKAIKDSVSKAKLAAVEAFKDSVAKAKMIEPAKTKVATPVKTATKEATKTKVEPATTTAATAKDTAMTTGNDDQRAKDLEAEIKRKTEELREKVKKAKSW